jgi:hypothetical protein
MGIFIIAPVSLESSVLFLQLLDPPYLPHLLTPSPILSHARIAP